MDEHIHDWETCSGWGVVFGVSRCKICGKIATNKDFYKQPLISFDDTKNCPNEKLIFKKLKYQPRCVVCNAK